VRYGYHVPEMPAGVVVVPKKVAAVAVNSTTSIPLIKRRQRRLGPGSRSHTKPSKPLGTTIRDILQSARFEGNSFHSSSSPGVGSGESHSGVGESEKDVDVPSVEGGEPVSQESATSWRYTLQKLAKGKLQPTKEDLIEFDRAMQQIEKQKADISVEVFKKSRLGRCIKVISTLGSDTLPLDDTEYELVRRANKLVKFWHNKFVGHEGADESHDE